MRPTHRSKAGIWTQPQDPHREAIAQWERRHLPRPAGRRPSSQSANQPSTPTTSSGARPPPHGVTRRRRTSKTRLTEVSRSTFPGSTAAAWSTKPGLKQQPAAHMHVTQGQAELEGMKASIPAMGGRKLRKETPTRALPPNIWAPAESREMAGVPAPMRPSAQYQRQPTLRGGREFPLINPTAHPA